MQRGDGQWRHQDDCMFPLFSKLQINSDCLTFDPQSNPDWNPYLTDYIIHIHFLSEDLHCCLHVIRCFAPLTGQKSMFVYAVGCFFCPFSHLIMWLYLGLFCQSMSALTQLSDLIWTLIKCSFTCIINVLWCSLLYDCNYPCVVSFSVLPA